jgi:tetratricopeptide (TPR) repeat protein
MLALAIANVAIAERLEPASFPPGIVYDLQAKAYAELGNARRITDDFPNAEADYLHAAQHARMGTGDRSLLAEIAYMAASVYRATRNFEKAFLLLDRAYEIHRELGDDHLAGRALINKGLAKGYRGDALEAMALLHEGLGLLDRDRDPRLLLAGIHNLIWFEVDGGHFTEGRALVRAHLNLYQQYGCRFDHLRLHWLEARIAAGLGEPAEAEAAFLAARTGFAEHRLTYVEALISLDLAALWLGQGRTSEISALIEEILGTFRALGIHREAIAVLLMLEEAVAADRLTLALLGSAAAKLWALEQGRDSA